jgi:hypothetical protein
VVALASIVALAGALVAGPDFGLIIGSALALLPVAAAIVWPRWFGETSNWARPQDEALVENPSDPAVWIVQVDIVQDGKVTGTDRGVIGFDQGTMFFTGHACSFVLGAQDIGVQSVRRGMMPSKMFRRALWQTIPLHHPNREVWICLLPLFSPSAPQERHRGNLANALAHFVNDSANTHLKRQYPPLDVQPK